MHGPLLLSLTIPSGLLFQFMILPRPFVVITTSFALNLTKDVKHLRCCVKRKKRKKVSLPKYLGLSMFLSTAEIPPLPPAVGRKKTLLLIIRNSSKVKGGKALHWRYDWNSNIDPSAKLQCNRNNMTIHIPKTLLPGINREHLRLLDTPRYVSWKYSSAVFFPVMVWCHPLVGEQSTKK